MSWHLFRHTCQADARSTVVTFIQDLIRSCSWSVTHRFDGQSASNACTLGELRIHRSWSYKAWCVSDSLPSARLVTSQEPLCSRSCKIWSASGTSLISVSSSVIFNLFTLQDHKQLQKYIYNARKVGNKSKARKARISFRERRTDYFQEGLRLVR